MAPPQQQDLSLPIKQRLNLLDWTFAFYLLEFCVGLVQSIFLLILNAARKLPIQIFVLQVVSFLASTISRVLFFRRLLLNKHLGVSRRYAQSHLICSLFTLGANTAVPVWAGCTRRYWITAIVASILLPWNILLALVSLESVFGERHRNLAPGVKIKPISTTWADIRTVPLFSLKSVYGPFVRLRTKYNLRTFEPETGKYPRMYPLKSLILGKSGTKNTDSAADSEKFEAKT